MVIKLKLAVIFGRLSDLIPFAANHGVTVKIRPDVSVEMIKYITCE